MYVDARPRRMEQVKWQEVDGEGILVHLQTGFYFSLNAVGLFIWKNCDGQHSCQSIAAGLVERFDVDEITARRDVTEFVNTLEREGLLRLDHPRSASEL